jgi:hypothetical protein
VTVPVAGVAAFTQDATTPPASSAPPAVEPEHPGRWLGGAIAALLSLFAAIIADGLQGRYQDLPSIDWLSIGLLGIPVGFALGRQFGPRATSGGWPTTLATGALVGSVAPPIGAIEILATSGVLQTAGLGELGNGPAALILLPIAIPLSFIAIVLTLPVGIAWSIAMRLVPAFVFTGVRAPRWLARLGVRHAVGVAFALLLVFQLVR